MFKGQFTLDDARYILPKIEDRHDLAAVLTAAASTQAIALSNNRGRCPDLPAEPLMFALACAYINAAATLSGVDATGLTAEVGDAGDPNGLLTALDLVGASVGLSFLGGAGVERMALQAGAFSPQVLYTATGGSTPEVGEATGGEVDYSTYYALFPAAVL